MSNQFIKFLFAGGFSAAINILSRILISLVFDYKIAVILAYLIGMTTAFILSRKYVFPKSGRAAKAEYTRFTIVNIIAAIQVWAISVGFALYVFPAIGFNFYPELVAHIIGVIFPIFTSYYGHKLFTFRARNP